MKPKGKIQVSLEIDMRIYNFSRAKLLLRKKKYQEGLLARTDGQLDNLERLVHDLGIAQVEKQVLMHNGIHSTTLSSELRLSQFPAPNSFELTLKFGP